MTSDQQTSETAARPVKCTDAMTRAVQSAKRASVSIAGDEIEIGDRQYVNASRLASILGVSVRTLSRWNAAGTGPPKIKVGKKVLFDLLKLSDWLTSRET
jgi:DNA-binding transcriptional regulator YiaG